MSLTLLTDGSSFGLGFFFFLLHGAQGVLENDFGILVAGVGGLCGTNWCTCKGRKRCGTGVLNATNDLVTDACTGSKACLDTDNSKHGVADGSRAGLCTDGHEARNGVDEVREIIGRIGCIAVASLAAD